ncbi:SAV_2336 N-terminal domain-related protein [Streptomyces sp. NPDC048581]|uniref:SAV_2336 N-terminal domain-related protein n=1 Tax=Streptomyces sp. NPDC048581 TaxID=3365572 RepID=UPI0037200FFB
MLGSVTGADPSTEGAATPRELAELLWFARQLGPEEQAGQEGPAASGQAAPAAHARRSTTPTAVPPSPDTAPHPTDHRHQPSPPPPDTRIPLHLPEPPHPDAPGGPGRGRGTPLLAPAPPMLPHPLALQRALRPLKRKVPAPHARLLDEHATADRIARLGAHPDAWLPVLRPAPDRWLRLNLVYDAGPTMPVWRPLVRELHTVLAQSGIFRTVTVHRATPDGRARQVPALADGRTVTLIVSDCMGPQWRPGPAGDRWYRTLRRWASRMPLAVVQPLPEHLWHTTALPAAPGLLTAPSSAAPSAALTFTPYDAHDPHLAYGAHDARNPHGPHNPHGGAVPLPVLEPTPTWLANWAALIAAPGGGHAPGALAWLAPAPLPPAEPAPGVSSLPAEDLVLRFRATASPEAFRIAGHLALANPSLPVMRLVQRALDRSPRPQHLAEIILSGMLTALPGPPGSYEFRPGVRELLLRSLPRTARTRTREFLARVGGLIDERAGLAAGEFRAEVRRGAADGDGGAGPAFATAGTGSAFATVSAETVRRLGGEPAEELVGGRYRLLGQRGPSERMWAAVDVRTDQTVVVHLYPPQEAPHERFLREARALAELRHPNVVRVLDHGVHDERPYLVAEFVDGVTVAELQHGSGPGVSFRVFARLATDVLPALEALHERGLVRGQDGWDGLLLRPDGSVVISRFALGKQSEGPDAWSDLFRFGTLLRDLAAHSPVSPGFQRMQAELASDTDPVRFLRRLRRTIPLGWAQDGIGADRLRIALLGPLNISRQNRLLPLPSPDALALLCMLALQQGRRVGRAELAAGLWEEPPSGLEALRRLDAVAREIRQCLGPGTLAELSDGYALHLPGDYIDVHHCEELVAGSTDDMDPQLQRSLVQDALDLFHGDPLEGLPGPAATATRDRLRALRLELLGQARDSEAIESYESHAERPQRQHGEPVDAALRKPHQELIAAGQERATVLIEFTDPRGHTWPDGTFQIEFSDSREPLPPHRALGRALPRMLEPGRVYDGVAGLTGGYLVTAKPGDSVLPLLDSVPRELTALLAESEQPPPKIRVTFWHAAQPDLADALERSAADTTDVTIVLSPVLHQELASGDPDFVDLALFRPLYREQPEAGPPIAWYWPLELPRPASEPEPLPGAEQRRYPVLGPYITRDPDALRPPTGGAAIVHTMPDGSLALLDRAWPHGRRSRSPVTYYRVYRHRSLTPFSLALPSSGDELFDLMFEMSWRVEDPVALVQADIDDVEKRLLDHLREEGGRITRRFSPSAGFQAQRALNGLGGWPVPGLMVRCRALSASPALRPPTPVRGSLLRTVLTDARAVLLGFDGPLVRLYGGTDGESRATGELIRLLTELRHPDDALSGEPLLTTAGPAAAPEGRPNPLDLLRALAAHRLGPELGRALARIEQKSAAGARATPHSDALAVILRTTGRDVAVVADNAPDVVRKALAPRALQLRGGVHGRADDLSLLMPHPDCLQRALTALHTAPEQAVLIASSVAELTAARSIGLPAIGYAHSEQHATLLRQATECVTTLQSLAPILDVVEHG